MSSQPDRISHPWRKYLRFSVRGLIVFVIVVGAGLGWVVRQAHIQRDAVAAIVRAGGVVEYDWQRGNGKSIPGGEPSAPRWLVHLIGGDYFGHVTAVWLSDTKETDAPLADVGRLTRLEEFYINSQAISDAGLEHLTGLTNLSVLWLYRTQVTDVGLAHLKGLTQLEQDLGDPAAAVAKTACRCCRNSKVCLLPSLRPVFAAVPSAESPAPTLGRHVSADPRVGRRTRVMPSRDRH
jgi:hypothetical protein